MITDLLEFVGLIGATIVVVHWLRTLPRWEASVLVKGVAVLLAVAAGVVGVGLLMLILVG